MSWIIVAYLFANTLAVPILGSLGDAFGRRRILALSLLVAVAGGLLAALAPSLPALVAARMVQGVGGGGVIVLSLAMIGERVPRAERGRAHGTIATVMVTASATGPLLGGLVTDLVGWRGVFLLPVPFGLLGLVLLRRLGGGEAGAGRSGPFDVAGLVLLALPSPAPSR